jgi:hypothetical protein
MPAAVEGAVPPAVPGGERKVVAIAAILVLAHLFLPLVTARVLCPPETRERQGHVILATHAGESRHMPRKPKPPDAPRSEFALRMTRLRKAFSLT